MPLSVAIASDHAGFDLKQQIVIFLGELGHAPLDLGPASTASVDYPDYARALAEAVLAGKAERGVLICGSGIGMSMAANRHKGIRAALVHGGLEARLSRQHNNANVLCLGARIIGIEAAKDALREFLATPFEGGRHQGRVEKMG